MARAAAASLGSTSPDDLERYADMLDAGLMPSGPGGFGGGGGASAGGGFGGGGGGFGGPDMQEMMSKMQARPRLGSCAAALGDPNMLRAATDRFVAAPQSWHLVLRRGRCQSARHDSAGAAAVRTWHGLDSL